VAVSLTAHVDPVAMARMDAVLAQLRAEAGLTAKQIVKRSAMATLNSASAATPLSMAKRPVVEANLRGVNKAGVKWAAKWGVESFRSDGWRVVIPVFGSRSDALVSPARKIRLRGLAKRAWRIMLGRMLDTGTAAGGQLAEIASRYTAVTKRETPLRLSLTGDMMLGYMEKLNRQWGILSTAVAKGASTMSRELEHASEQWVVAKWRRL
jgi:hypothetical protein